MRFARRPHINWEPLPSPRKVAMMVSTPAGLRVRMETNEFVYRLMRGEPKPLMPVTAGVFALFNSTAPR
jgi:hypothetical protein